MQLVESELPVATGLADACKNTDYVWQQIEDLTEQNCIFEVLIFSVTDGSTIHGNLFAYPRSLAEKRNSSAFRDDPKLFFNKFLQNGVFDFRAHLLEMKMIERSEETPISLRNNAERMCLLRRQVKGLSEDFVQASHVEVQSVRARGEVELHGPFSPLVLNFRGLTKKFCGGFQVSSILCVQIITILFYRGGFRNFSTGGRVFQKLRTGARALFEYLKVRKLGSFSRL